MTCFATLVVSAICLGQDSIVISPATEDQGIFVHTVESPYQEGKTEIRVLLPDERKPDRLFKAVYALPVEARNEARYGDGLIEVKKSDLHNKHQLAFIAPTFSHLPWYADHSSDLRIRQETYLLTVVLPFVERNYPVETKPESRLLVGFSKSGYGAWSLLLRHPEMFGRAAAWDAPLMMDQVGKYGAPPIFGTPANFEKYRIIDLLRARAESLGSSKRLILTGYGGFRQDHERAHALLKELKIPHEYRDGPQRKHDWHSGWLPEAVELLLNQ